MDREVAAGWFDETLLDLDYKFTPYLHNVPDRDSLQGSRASDASSNLHQRLEWSHDQSFDQSLEFSFDESLDETL